MILVFKIMILCRGGRWWPFHGADCPCLLTRLLGCFLLSRRLERILIDFISNKEKIIHVVIFKDSLIWRLIEEHGDDLTEI